VTVPSETQIIDYLIFDADDRDIGTFSRAKTTRAGQTPPSWTASVGAAPAPLFLVRTAKTSKVLRRESLTHTPEPLKKRNVFALRDYLDVL